MIGEACYLFIVDQLLPSTKWQNLKLSLDRPLFSYFPANLGLCRYFATSFSACVVLLVVGSAIYLWVISLALGTCFRL
jgi:hypothetical protein